MFDHTELKGKIRGRGFTVESFALAFGISRTAMDRKLNGPGKWTDADIDKAIEILGIKDEGEIKALFFSKL